jgi:SMC interacting uncharacterized protein involved in chromosome segregation
MLKKHKKDDEVIALIRQILLEFHTEQCVLLRTIQKQGERIMSQLDDLNKAISDEDVEIQDILASVTKVGTDIDALLAKIAAGGTMPDITTQLQAIQSHVASLTTASQQLKDEDAKANG